MEHGNFSCSRGKGRLRYDAVWSTVAWMDIVDRFHPEHLAPRSVDKHKHHSPFDRALIIIVICIIIFVTIFSSIILIIIIIIVFIFIIITITIMMMWVHLVVAQYFDISIYSGLVYMVLAQYFDKSIYTGYVLC